MRHRVRVLKTYRKASFWRRFAASVIDAIIMTIVVVLFRRTLELDDVILHWVDFFLFYGYHVLMDFYFQGSFGKEFLNIKVISVDKQRVTFLNSFYRNLGKIVSALPLMYGYLRILAPHQRQTIHDELGHCYVVQITGKKEVI